jgi:isoleucyl-tRNA synthetase
MPFAQWGYPHTKNSDQHFKAQFPADFISEAIDQTRGWFYAQLAISTLIWKSPNDETRMTNDANAKSDIRHSSFENSSFPYPHPFRNCIVLGHMLGEDGQKMSKRKRNYREPTEIFDRYGADALRWYFFANQPPWTSIRYNEQAIKDSIPEFLLRLWNVYSFFVIYANIDGFDPAEESSRGAEEERRRGGEQKGSVSEAYSTTPLLHFSSAPSYRPLDERSELDRWILSELNRTCAAVVERMDAYDNYAACGHITAFVDALSNWYVRRSRDRFWSADKRDQNKLDAYWTLYEALVTTTKLVAPFVPFLAETLWQNVTSVFRTGASDEQRGASKTPPPTSSLAPRSSLLAPPESVHLTDFPIGDAAAVDEALSARMNLVRLISSLGRNARSAAGLKVRQPLAKVEVILADTQHQKWLEEHAAVIEEELNVKQLEFSDDPSLYVEHEIVPNFKRLGPKLGKLLPKVKQWLGQQTGAQLLENIRDNGQIDLTIDGQAIALSREEVEVRIKPRPGWAAANDQGVVVVLSTELTPELIAEGLARDLVRLIQDSRKEIGCEYTDRIEVAVVTTSTELQQAIEKFGDYIKSETLAMKLASEPLPGVAPVESKVGDAALQLYVRVAS